MRIIQIHISIYICIFKLDFSIREKNPITTQQKKPFLLFLFEVSHSCCHIYLNCEHFRQLYI